MNQSKGGSGALSGFMGHPFSQISCPIRMRPLGLPETAHCSANLEKRVSGFRGLVGPLATKNRKAVDGISHAPIVSANSPSQI